MLAATFLIVARCAEPNFCPTNVELKRAVREYRETAEMAFFLSLSEEERGGTTLTPWPIGGVEGALAMSEAWLSSEAQMHRIEPYFPLSHGVPRGMTGG